MKTIVTFLIALLAFATSLAWAGPDASPAARASIEQSQPAAASPSAKPSGTVSRQATPKRVDPARSGAGGTTGAAGFSFELPAAGPAVICACVADRRLG